MTKALIFTIIFLFLFPVKLILADSGLTISPAVNDLILKPGETYVGSFNLKNDNEYNVTLEVTRGLLGLNSEILTDNFTNNSTQWISLDQNKSELISQRDITYNYTITIPNDAQEGLYRPIFILKLSSDLNESGSTTSLTQLLPFQLNIYVSQSGVYNGNIQINKLKVDSSILVGTQQKVDFTLTNTSSSPSKPLVRIQLLSPDKEIIFQTVENDNLAFLYQNQDLSRSIDLTSAFKSDSKIGRYTVELFSTDTLNNMKVSKKITFLYIPQNIVNLFTVLVAIGLLSLFIFSSIKRTLKKRKKGDKHLFMYK